MGAYSLIEWCLHTANLWWGCKEVHAGCDHCYARVFARAKGKAAAWNGVRFATKGIWSDFLKWQRAAAAAGEMHRVFCGSMMDIFEKPLPASDWQGNPLGITTGDIRDRFFREVVPACPNLLFLLLTKRPGNAPKYVPAEWLEDWPANVMTGTSVVDQATADTLIPQLLRSPGSRFLSCEPLLGPIDLMNRQYLWPRPGVLGHTIKHGADPMFCHMDDEHIPPAIDWVIAGGESGPKARPMHVDWARSLRDQCVAAGIAYFFKQWGEFRPVGRKIIDGISVAEPGDWLFERVGKKAAGRLLDGREWNEIPNVEAPIHA